MPHNITPSSTWTTPITAIADLDAASQANFDLAPQALANRLEVVKDRALGGVTSWPRTSVPKKVAVAGASFTGTGTGNAGALFTGGSAGSGISAAGTTSGHGILATGGSSGNGIQGQATGSGAHGFRGASSAGSGGYFTGGGANAGFRAVGGATGAGASFEGGATSGSGISASATEGDGLSATGGGAGHGIDATAGATGSDIDGLLSTAAAEAIADAHLDRADAIETGTTPRQAARYMAAILAGKTSGAGTDTEVFKGIGTNTTRVTASVNADGERSAVTLG